MVEYGSPLPKAEVVRGYKVERAPIGRMLMALEKMRAVPAELVGAMFPGKTMEQLASGEYSPTLVDIIGAALTAAPKYVIELTSHLTGIDRERLENDPDIGLDGIVEILDAWLSVNNILNFTGAVQALRRVWTGKSASVEGSDGFTGSSPSGLESGSGSGSCLRITTLTRLAESLRSTRS